MLVEGRACAWKERAIAEWPTPTDGKSGRADYVLFAGLTAVAVVEAKRKHKDLPGVIDQAKRYSAGLTIEAGVELPEGTHRRACEDLAGIATRYRATDLVPRLLPEGGG